MKESIPMYKIDNINLKLVIVYVYFYAQIKYYIIEENSNIKEILDFILFFFFPKKKMK